MKIHPEFPEHQRRDPNLKAVLEAYDEIASSPQAGAALYHRPDDPKPCGLDFTIWVEETARFGLSVANGEYCVAEGQWLHSTDGTTAKRRSSPIHRTWRAAATVREAIKETTHSGAFVIPVVAFADMTFDEDIDRAFQGSGVRPVWSLEDLVDQLVALVDVQEFYTGLTAELIQRELRGFGLEAAPDEPPARDLPMELSTGQVVIQHVDTLNVYTIGAHGAGHSVDSLPRASNRLRCPDTSNVSGQRQLPLAHTTDKRGCRITIQTCDPIKAWHARRQAPFASR